MPPPEMRPNHGTVGMKEKVRGFSDCPDQRRNTGRSSPSALTSKALSAPPRCGSTSTTAASLSIRSLLVIGVPLSRPLTQDWHGPLSFGNRRGGKMRLIQYSDASGARAVGAIVDAGEPRSV